MRLRWIRRPVVGAPPPGAVFEFDKLRAEAMERFGGVPSREFDGVFAAAAKKHPFKGLVMPVSYMRALAQAESSMNPREETGSKRGLFSIGRPVVDDVNKKTGASFSMEEMFDPVDASFVFTAYWQHIIAPVLARHADTRFGRNLQVDWNNPEYALLVTASWNSGVGVVEDMVKKILKRGELVTHNALAAQRDREPLLAPPGFRQPRVLLRFQKLVFQRSVVGLFLLGEAIDPTIIRAKRVGLSGWGWLIVLALLSDEL